MKHIQLFWMLATYSLKTTLMSPMSIIVLLMGKFLRFSLFFIFIWYVVSYTNILVGYTTSQTMLFYLTFMIIDTFAQCMFREVSRFRRLVATGELDSVLLKPHHPFLRILVGGVDVIDLVLLLIYVGVAVALIFQLSLLSFVQIAIYGALLINSFIIVTSIHIIILALGIVTAEVDHTIMMYRDITRMGMFPIEMYQQVLQFFLTFIIPVGIMVTVPVRGLLNLLDVSWYLISVLISALFLVGSLVLWKYSLRVYQSWGG